MRTCTSSLSRLVGVVLWLGQRVDVKRLEVTFTLFTQDFLNRLLTGSPPCELSIRLVTRDNLNRFLIGLPSNRLQNDL